MQGDLEQSIITVHLYQTKNFFVLNAERFFPTLASAEHVEKQHTGLGLASVCQALADEEDSEKNDTTNHQSGKKEGQDR